MYSHTVDPVHFAIVRVNQREGVDVRINEERPLSGILWQSDITVRHYETIVFL